VFDDTIITMKHEGYLLCVLISGFVTFIKTGNPLFFKRMCQIGSELIHLTACMRKFITMLNAMLRDQVEWAY
ncbi:MAG: hypothetical protein RPU91_13915, partial [Candidatus Sedimenticola sp. (ex Thyasira tokunagai)]